MKRRTRSFVAVAAALVALCSTGARAQDSAAVSAGARLRVRSDSAASWQYGRFGGLVADSIILRPARGDASRRIAIGTLRDIDVRQPDRRARQSNTILGAILGLASGVLAVDLSIRRCERRHPHSDGPPCAIGWGGLPIAAVGGAVVGGLAGRAWPAHRWQRVVLVPAH